MASIQAPEPRWMSILRVIAALMALVPEIVYPIVKERQNMLPDIKSHDDKPAAV